MAFEWDLFIYQEDEMIIEIKPYHRKNLSLSSYGKDNLIFKMKPNNIVRSRNTGLTLEEQTLKDREYKYPIFPVFSNTETMEQSFRTATRFAIALQASTFVLNIFLSKTL